MKGSESECTLKADSSGFLTSIALWYRPSSGTSGKAEIHDNFTPATPLKRLPPAIVRTGSGKNAHPPVRKGVNQIDTPGKKKQDTNDEEKSIGNNLPGIPDDDKNTQ